MDIGLYKNLSIHIAAMLYVSSTLYKHGWLGLLIPDIIISCLSCNSKPLEYIKLLELFSLACFALAYLFEIVSQVTGVREYELNKSSRPILVGLVSYEGAQRRDKKKGIYLLNASIGHRRAFEISHSTKVIVDTFQG